MWVLSEAHLFVVGRPNDVNPHEPWGWFLLHVLIPFSKLLSTALNFKPDFGHLAAVISKADGSLHGFHGRPHRRVCIILYGLSSSPGLERLLIADSITNEGEKVRYLKRQGKKQKEDEQKISLLKMMQSYRYVRIFIIDKRLRDAFAIHTKLFPLKPTHFPVKKIFPKLLANAWLPDSSG